MFVALLALTLGQHDKKAAEIYEVMKETYASCSTYTDTGTLNSDDEKLSFITHFRRPTKFYFEFNELTGDKGRYVLWCPGSAQAGPGAFLETHTWDSRGRIKESEELGSAIAGFTGISSGAACTTSPFLLPGAIRMGNIAHVGDFVYERGESIRGEICDVLYSNQQVVRVWVSQKRHILMRVWEKMGSSTEITDLNPSINEDIPDSKFMFAPPKK